MWVQCSRVETGDWISASHHITTNQQRGIYYRKKQLLICKFIFQRKDIFALSLLWLLYSFRRYHNSHSKQKITKKIRGIITLPLYIQYNFDSLIQYHFYFRFFFKNGRFLRISINFINCQTLNLSRQQLFQLEANFLSQKYLEFFMYNKIELACFNCGNYATKATLLRLLSSCCLQTAVYLTAYLQICDSRN